MLNSSILCAVRFRKWELEMWTKRSRDRERGGGVGDVCSCELFGSFFDLVFSKDFDFDYIDVVHLIWNKTEPRLDFSLVKCIIWPKNVLHIAPCFQWHEMLWRNFQLLVRFYLLTFLQVQTIVAEFTRRCCWFLFLKLDVSETWRPTFNAFFIFDSTCRSDPTWKMVTYSQKSAHFTTHIKMERWRKGKTARARERERAKVKVEPKFKPIILYYASICSIFAIGKTNEA